MRTLTRPAILALACWAPGSLAGQTVFNQAHSILGGLCVGDDCTALEQNLVDNRLKIKGNKTAMLFQDTSNSPYPTTNWRLEANEFEINGRDAFSLQDYDSGNRILRVEAGAPENALTVSGYGFVGLGTFLPEQELHVATTSYPTLRLEQLNGGLPPPGVWDVFATGNGFYVSEPDNSLSLPFSIVGGAPSFALRVAQSGDIGTGLSAPEASLHIRRDDGTARALVEEISGVSAPRTLLDIRNNGRPELVMANTATGGEWSFGAGTNFVLKQGALGSDSAAKTKHLTLFAGSGDLRITGQIITGGPSCTAGCDAVFDADYDLPSITEHAERMQVLGHLPNVGPTSPEQPMNMSDKLGGVLNELEHAHLYIAQLHRENAEQREINARLEARLLRIEAALDAGVVQ